MNFKDLPKDLVVDNAFFEQIVDAEKIVRPLTKASFVIQRDCNTLADVLNMFGLLRYWMILKYSKNKCIHVGIALSVIFILF